MTFCDLERELLTLARDGYRQKETGLVVGKDVRTIRRYWLMITSKLGARTVAQAVALAIQKGIISTYNGENGTKLIRGTH